MPASLRTATDEVLESLFGDSELPGGGDKAGPESRAELEQELANLGRPDGVRGSFGSGRGPIVLRSPKLLIRGKVELPVRVLGRRAGR